MRSPCPPPPPSVAQFWWSLAVRSSLAPFPPSSPLEIRNI